jgi:RNA polymerase sigma-70 factor, ECF subfamily
MPAVEWAFVANRDVDGAQLGRRAVASPRATLHYASPDEVFRLEYARLVSALSVWSGDREAAADAVQDAFLELIRRWNRIGTYDDPVGWVRRVSINRLRSHHRVLASRALALARLARARPHPDVADPTVGGVSPEMKAAFARLGPRQRMAMTLFYVADLPTLEVAEAMGISEGAVQQHLHRARAALREAIGDTR